MALGQDLRQRLRLPAFCAPMTMISGPELVTAACNAGLAAALPIHNASSEAELSSWLRQIQDSRRTFAEAHPTAPRGELFINLTSRKRGPELTSDVDLCIGQGVSGFISATGDPTERTARVHERGGVLFHDVTTFAHAEKAIRAGADGLICIGAGGGGHSGGASPLVWVSRLREIFDGVIVMAGAISSGAAIRAAEILGADLAYLGTRFIATTEARAPDAYKAMIVRHSSEDLIFTPRITGIPANWLRPSLEVNAMAPDSLPLPAGPRNYEHLPAGVSPWRDLWSAGQGIDLIHDIPSVAELVDRLADEYQRACNAPPFK